MTLIAYKGYTGTMAAIEAHKGIGKMTDKLLDTLRYGDQWEDSNVVCAVSRQTCNEAADEIERLRAGLTEAIEALKPFAKLVKPNPRYDQVFVMTSFTCEDCAQAMTVVEKHKEASK